MTSPTTPRAPRLALALLSASVLLGCDREDADSRAIAEARNSLLALGTGGTHASPAGVREKGFNEAASRLQGVTGDGASVAQGQGLAAAAIIGQAEIIQAKFRTADAALTRLVTLARAKLDLCIRQQSLANSISGYDPRPDLDRIENAARERAAELQQARTSLEQNNAEVVRLRSASEAKSAEGRGLRENAAALRQRLFGASTGSRPQIAEEVHLASREADSRLKEADLLAAEAERIAPLSREIEFEVGRIEMQIANLAETKRQIEAHAAALRAQAEQARESAASAATELASALESVRSELAQQVKPPYEESISKLQTAGSKLASGRSAGGAGQNVISGSISQAIAAMHREYAEALARVRALHEEAARIEPPISGSEAIAEALSALTEEHKTVSNAAIEAYAKARDAFSSAGGGGGGSDLGERLASLAARINAMYIKIGGMPEPDPNAPPNEEPQGSDMAPANGEAPAPSETVPEGSIEAPSEPAGDLPTEPATPDGETAPPTSDQEPQR